MNEVKHRIVETNGIRMHLAEQGAGPLVVLCHGFPELVLVLVAPSTRGTC
jgi:pimeloyl-ACP methyl ester carboxylesterase